MTTTPATLTLTALRTHVAEITVSFDFSPRLKAGDSTPYEVEFLFR